MLPTSFKTRSLLARAGVALCAAGALLASPVALAQGALFSLSVRSEPAGQERPLDITMRETERSPDFSIVELEVRSEGGQSAPLFLVRGFCGLMHAREQHLAVAEQTSERPIRFRVTFPTAPPGGDAHGLPRMVLADQQCAALPKQE